MIARIYKFFVVFLLLAVSNRGYAQDVHFSQFNMSPLTLNPGETGNFVGDCRVVNNLRQQWKAIGIPYQTLDLSYEKQLYLGEHHLTAGLILVHDRSGDAELTLNKFYLTASYHRNILGQGLHAGMQIGYVKKSFSMDALTFPNQFDITQGMFVNDNPSLPNNEQSYGLGESLSYLDANAGIVWTGHFNKFRPEAGIALFHFIFPKETFFDNGDNHLKPRTVIHGQGIYDINETWYGRPKLLYMLTRKASDVVVGADLGYKLGTNKYKIKSIYAGANYRDGFWRNKDAMIAVGGIEFNRVDIGLSYDVNISGLKIATQKHGALEFSFIYRCKSSQPPKITIPCDRL
ncbi:MAG: PorP/SprF family type IX secretion system membrane protein [Flavobacteriales bacterium]|nr:PorP/SprF family type IX secretion system membrane protein [Flavobacteriales bacterium]MCB9446764.1 PorP/SprF family type IX secretion system membrane protein [Flavobacteriales bacterium]